MRVALVAAFALLLAGCSSPPADDAAPAAEDPAASALLAPPPVPLHFASGDFEAISTYEATFQPTDMCVPECQGTALQLIDLSNVVPAEAPVELSVIVEHDGSIQSSLVFTDADPVQMSQEGNGNFGGGGGGGNTQISALVSRAPTGLVELRLTHRFVAINPGAGAPAAVTAHVEVRSVVRSDVLVDGMPAAIDVPAGTVLNFTAGDLAQVILVTASGQVVRDVDTPFSLTVPNGTSGPSVVMVTGGETQVLGPNTTMAAKRVALVESAPKDVATGITSLDFTAEKLPLLVGVVLQAKGTAGFVSAAPLMGPFTLTVTAPGNVVVLTADCGGNFGPVCQFSPFSFAGNTDFAASSGFLDEHLLPGDYAVELSAQQANNYEAYTFYLQILD